MPHQHKFPAALRQRAAITGLVIQIEAAVRQTKMDALDVELYPAVKLHRRAGDVELRGFERIDFHCMLYVISGRYLHVVDFDMLDCARGSIVVLQPGQVHRFGDLSGWDGWLLIFRSGVPPPPQPRIGKAVDEIKMLLQLQSLPTNRGTRHTLRGLVAFHPRQVARVLRCMGIFPPARRHLCPLRRRRSSHHATRGRRLYHPPRFCRHMGSA